MFVAGFLFPLLMLDLALAETILHKYHVVQDVIVHSVQTLDDVSLTECGIMCTANETCMLFQYDDTLQICQIGTNLMLLSLSPSTIGQSVYVRGPSYKFVQITTTFYQAKAYCESDGGQLVKVQSAEMTTTIIQWLDAYGANDNNEVFGPYIGLNDIVNEGVYVWGDGSPVVSYTNWESLPNADLEDCVHMFYSSAAMGQWNDIDCNTQLYYICQYD